MNSIGSENQFEGNNRTESFLNLLVPIQGKVYAYILSRWPNKTEADDIMQETITVMWRKYDTYKQDTDFLMWAITIAKYTVLSHRKKHFKNSLQFNDEVLKTLQARSDGFLKTMDSRLDALDSCVRKLGESDRELLAMKYFRDLPVKRIAVRYDITPRSIYKSLSKIHDVLLRCIRRSLAKEGVL